MLIYNIKWICRWLVCSWYQGGNAGWQERNTSLCGDLNSFFIQILLQKFVFIVAQHSYLIKIRIQQYMVTTYLCIHFFGGLVQRWQGVQLSCTNLLIISLRCFIYDKMQDAGRTVQKAINTDLFRVEETSHAGYFESCFLFQCSSNSTFPFFLLSDSLNKKRRV